MQDDEPAETRIHPARQSYTAADFPVHSSMRSFLSGELPAPSLVGVSLLSSIDGQPSAIYAPVSPTGSPASIPLSVVRSRNPTSFDVSDISTPTSAAVLREQTLFTVSRNSSRFSKQTVSDDQEQLSPVRSFPVPAITPDSIPRPQAPSLPSTPTPSGGPTDSPDSPDSVQASPLAPQQPPHPATPPTVAPRDFEVDTDIDSTISGPSPQSVAIAATPPRTPLTRRVNSSPARPTSGTSPSRSGRSALSPSRTPDRHESPPTRSARQALNFEQVGHRPATAARRHILPPAVTQPTLAMPVEALNSTDEFMEREKWLRIELESTCDELRRQNRELQHEVEELKKSDLRAIVREGGTLDGFNAEALRQLEQSVKEQETLISAYQKENEKLTTEVKEARALLKTQSHDLQAKNKELSEELAMLKHQIEQKRLVGADDDAHQAILDLEQQLEAARAVATQRETELKFELDRLRVEKRNLEAKLGGVDLKRMESDGHVLRQLEQQLQRNNEEHKEEIVRLNARIQFYIHNQELINKNDEKILAQQALIDELRRSLEQYEKGEAGAGADLRKADARRIKALQQENAALQERLQKRDRDRAGGATIADMIQAVKASPEESEVVRQLRARVFELETAVTESEDETEKRVRVLRQEFDKMKAQYEQRLKEKTTDHPPVGPRALEREKTNARVKELEKQIDHLRSHYTKKVKELEGKLQGQQRLATGRPVTAPAAAVAPRAAKLTEEEYEERIATLNSEVQIRQTALDEMHEQLRSAALRNDSQIQTLTSQITEMRTELLHSQKEAGEATTQRNDVKVQEKMLQEAMDATDRLRHELNEANRQLMSERETNSRLIRTQPPPVVQAPKPILFDASIQVGESDASDTLSLKQAYTRARDQISSLEQHILSLEGKLQSDGATGTAIRLRELERALWDMEDKAARREAELQHLIDNMKRLSEDARNDAATEHRREIKAKNEQIERFRSELSSIMAVLARLQQSRK